MITICYFFMVCEQSCSGTLLIVMVSPMRCDGSDHDGVLVNQAVLLRTTLLYPTQESTNIKHA